MGANTIVGATLGGRYRIVRRIGEGGMGVVYEAEHLAIGRRVAVKVLRGDLSRRPESVERFRREARAAASIGHPGIVAVSDFGDTDQGESYLVMELLQGEDLADRLGRVCTLAPSEAVSVVHECCQALAAAHTAGIIHRDLKPENVFLCRDESGEQRVKLVDFGVAKMSDIEVLNGQTLTKTGMIFGTPEYMSPEHGAGVRLDHRADVYALGIILYEAITGRVPFEGNNFMAILAMHRTVDVPPLRETNPAVRVSPELEAVVMRALDKKRDNRPANARAFGDELAMCPEMPMTGSGSVRAAPSWATRAAPPPPPREPPNEPIVLVSDSVPPARGARALATLGGAALAAAVASWMWFAMLDPGVQSIPLPTVAVPQPAPAPAAPAAADAPAPKLELTAALAPEPREPAPAAPAPEPENVVVRVSSDPAGARISVLGRGRVCAKTPCSFETPRGEPVVVLAARGRGRARTRVQPSSATDLHLALAVPAQPKPAAPVAQQPAAPTDDLKVPAIFADVR